MPVEATTRRSVRGGRMIEGMGRWEKNTDSMIGAKAHGWRSSGHLFFLCYGISGKSFRRMILGSQGRSRRHASALDTKTKEMKTTTVSSFLHRVYSVLHQDIRVKYSQRGQAE